MDGHFVLCRCSRDGRDVELEFYRYTSLGWMKASFSRDRSLKRGAIHKTTSQPQSVTTMEKESEIVLGGVKLMCKHCGHDRFNTRNALLNTKVLTFFETDWLANTAEVFVCARCGFLHWVLPPDPGKIEKIGK